MKKKFVSLLAVACMIMSLVLPLVGCSGNSDKGKFSDGVFTGENTISADKDISGDVTIAEGATLTIKSGAHLYLDEKDTLFVKGTLNVEDGQWQTLNDIGIEKIGFYRGAQLYLGDKHIIGAEGDYSADILLGNTTWKARSEDAPVLVSYTNKVALSGKVYLNSTIHDNRKWDLGDDSAVILYADNALKFSEDEDSFGCVYTFGGHNTAPGFEFTQDQCGYFYYSDKWFSNPQNYASIIPEGAENMTEEELQVAVMGKLGGLLNYMKKADARSMEAMGGTPVWNGRAVDAETPADKEVGPDGQLIKNLKYTERAGTLNNYDLWLPKTVANGNKKGSDVPFILFIHGGSWSGGVKEEGNALCAKYAKMGYVTASLNYRLVLDENSVGYDLQNDYGAFAEMLDDIKDTIAAVKAQITDLGYVCSGMAVSGQSAGGHLAMLYAAKYGTDSVIPVKLVLDEYGPTDFSPDAWANNKIIWGDVADWNAWSKTYIANDDDPNWTVKMNNAADFVSGILRTNGYDVPLDAGTGNVTEEYKSNLLANWNNTDSEIYAQIKSISPVLMWDKYKTPLVGIHGEMDAIANVKGAYKLKETLETLGVDSNYIITPVNGHAQGIDRTAYAYYYEQSKIYLEKYLPQAI